MWCEFYPCYPLLKLQPKTACEIGLRRDYEQLRQPVWLLLRCVLVFILLNSAEGARRVGCGYRWKERSVLRLGTGQHETSDEDRIQDFVSRVEQRILLVSLIFSAGHFGSSLCTDWGKFSIVSIWEVLFIGIVRETKEKPSEWESGIIFTGKSEMPGKGLKKHPCIHCYNLGNDIRFELILNKVTYFSKIWKFLSKLLTKNQSGVATVQYFNFAPSISSSQLSCLHEL